MKLIERYTRYPPHGAVYLPPYGDLEEAANARIRAYAEFERRFSQGLVRSRTDVDAFVELLPPEETAALVKKSGVDAVIVGNAA